MIAGATFVAFDDGVYGCVADMSDAAVTLQCETDQRYDSARWDTRSATTPDALFGAIDAQRYAWRLNRQSLVLRSVWEAL